MEHVKSGEGLIDLVNDVRPVETPSVARSPFAKVVTRRGTLMTVFGQFNMRKAAIPWHDVRLRQAINLAVNREELIRDVKGHGVIIPALTPEGAFGHDPTLTPYPFDPDKARHLLWDAGYPEGLMVRLIAPEALQMQAISISMMLEQAGFTVERLPMGNFPAPPHDETGHTWHHADQWLFDIVKDGGLRFAPLRYRSAMPAYQDMLTDDEIWAVLAFIKSRWSVSTRAHQERETLRTR